MATARRLPSALRLVALSAAKEEIRPVLTVIRLEGDKAVTANGMSMIVAPLAEDYRNDDQPVHIDAKALAGAVKGKPDTFLLKVDEGKATVAQGAVQVDIPMMAHCAFPNYAGIEATAPPVKEAMYIGLKYLAMMVEAAKLAGCEAVRVQLPQGSNGPIRFDGYAGVQEFRGYVMPVRPRYGGDYDDPVFKRAEEAKAEADKVEVGDVGEPTPTV